jgi:Spermine/spermidine synthase domain
VTSGGHEARGPRLRSPEGYGLLSLGFLMLFLELALIRYLAGSIYNLGYFPNLVLISAFIGMGLGFTFHHAVSAPTSTALLHAAVFVLLGLVGFVYVAHPAVPGFTSWQGNLGGDLYFTAAPKSADHPSYAIFVICLVSIVAIFALLSQRAAKLFAVFPPLVAYSLDIVGSCVGIVTFMVFSWLTVPAAVWMGLFAVVLMVPLATGSKTPWLPLLPGAAIVFLVAKQDTRLTSDPTFTGPVEVTWSPYQKVEYTETGGARAVFVNGVHHQVILSPQDMAHWGYQAVYDARATDPSLPRYKNVLILGAGTGNDVTAALMNGAEHVDAVEIDPVIAELGVEHNPSRVYLDPRVNLVIDDARAFLTRTRVRYDLVVFALTDSLVKVSSMSQLRLENYLFTEESVRRAYAVLADRGDLVLLNYYRRPWLREKLLKLMRDGSGSEPRVLLQQKDFAVLAVEKGGPPAEPSAVLIDAPTDDWPFLYLERRGIPGIYAWAMAGMLVVIGAYVAVLHAWTRRREAYGGPGLLPLKLAFVLMGVAFSLLETKSVIQFALLFGTTWVNSSLVFLAVLLFVLAANWTAQVFPGVRRIGLVGALLIGSTLVAFVFPLGSLLSLESGFLRFAIASAVTFSPIFFANLVFSITFREQKVAAHIFGYNLLGATLGGVIEYTSMYFGYRTLSLVVAASYAAVLILLALWRRATLAVVPDAIAS